VFEWTKKVVTKTGDRWGRVVETFIDYNGKLYKGYAVCHPKDRFNFSYGAKLSFERALNKLTDEVRYESTEETIGGLSGFTFSISPYFSKKDTKKLWKEFLRHFPPSEKAWREEMVQLWEETQALSAQRKESDRE
jgi:hypothetical protein